MPLNIIFNILQQGLCYAIVALGVYISYKILNFPDLTVDSSFPLGAVVCIGLIQVGVPFIIALIVAFISGTLTGFITGFLHVKFKISPLLSGIITMTALLSINLAVAQGRTLIPYGDKTTLFNNAFTKLFGDNLSLIALANIIILLVIVIVIKVLMDLFFKTKRGYMLRAVGDNEQMGISLGSNSGFYKIFGLCLANGLVALAGAIYSQYMNYFDNTSGTGMVVIALASVIIGTAIFKHVKFVKGTTASIVGALIYTAVLNVIIALGVPTIYLKLVMALSFLVILILNYYFFSRDKKIKKGEKHV
ncbi:MAG: ABC transporter permease [Bacilli bacterium]|nr:ABC transporter permease [Bacilli bacterium]